MQVASKRAAVGQQALRQLTLASGSGGQSEGQVWSDLDSQLVQRECCNSIPCDDHRLLEKSWPDFDVTFLIFKCWHW